MDIVVCILIQVHGEFRIRDKIIIRPIHDQQNIIKVQYYYKMIIKIEESEKMKMVIDKDKYKRVKMESK